MQAETKGLKLKNPLSSIIHNLITENRFYLGATNEIENLIEMLKKLDEEPCFKYYCREINAKFAILDDPHLCYTAGIHSFPHRYLPLIFSGENCFYLRNEHLEEVHDINGIELKEELNRFGCTNLIHKQNSLLKYLALSDEPIVLNATKVPIDIALNLDNYGQLIKAKIEKMAVLKMQPSMLKRHHVNEYDVIRLFGFDHPDIVDSFGEALKATSTKKLIIDIRGNQGGLIEVAKTCASYFLSDKLLTYRYFCDGEIKEEWVEPNYINVLFDEILILQNERTASASEIIFIPALKKSGRNVITLGCTSAGFISQATKHILADGGVFTMSTSIILDEENRSIPFRGLIPDFSIHFGVLNSKSYDEIIEEYKSMKNMQGDIQ